MRRLICVKTDKQLPAPVRLVYHVTGAALLSQYRVCLETYDPTNGLSPVAEQCAIVYNDATVLQVPVTMTQYRRYLFLLDISENQPNGESIEITTVSDARITAYVYNENGVLVCSAVSQSTASGEMTSEPIEAPGEMTSEPIDGVGETIVPTDDQVSTI